MFIIFVQKCKLIEIFSFIHINYKQLYSQYMLQIILTYLRIKKKSKYIHMNYNDIVKNIMCL